MSEATDSEGRKQAEISDWQERTEAVEAMKHPKFLCSSTKIEHPCWHIYWESEITVIVGLVDETYTNK